MIWLFLMFGMVSVFLSCGGGGGTNNTDDNASIGVDAIIGTWAGTYSSTNEMGNGSITIAFNSDGTLSGHNEGTTSGDFIGTWDITGDEAWGKFGEASFTCQVSGNVMTGRMVYNSQDATLELTKQQTTDCNKNYNGLTVSLTDRQIYNFDSQTVVTSPTTNNNVIQWYKNGSPNGDDELTIGSNINHGDVAYTSQLSIAMGFSLAWSQVCPGDSSTYDFYITNNGKSVRAENEIFLVRLSDGETQIKLQIVSIGTASPDSVEFYWEYAQ